jgi:hypothetical protein
MYLMWLVKVSRALLDHMTKLTLEANIWAPDRRADSRLELVQHIYM